LCHIYLVANIEEKEKSPMIATSSIGEVQTPRAAIYLKHLCKHFSEEIPVEYSETEGFAHFPFGECRLLAKAQTLTFHCEAKDAAALAKMQDVIDKHIVMFTKRNPIILAWRNEPDIKTS
jgi:uncharacterized protein